MHKTQRQKDRFAISTLTPSRKEHEKEIYIQGSFMGFLIGSFAMALMIHFLQSL